MPCGTRYSAEEVMYTYGSLGSTQSEMRVGSSCGFHCFMLGIFHSKFKSAAIAPLRSHHGPLLQHR